MVGSIYFLLFWTFRGLSEGFIIPSISEHSGLGKRWSSTNGEVGQGPNWIERSFPVDVTGENLDPKKVDDYNLGICGESYGTGPLSARMYEAMTRNKEGASQEILDALKIYAMDFTAKEAVRAALVQNGLELVLSDEEQDEGLWADIDSIRLLDPNQEQGTVYDSWQEVVEDWTPGQAFSFVARQVQAKMKELSVDELLQALDPEGELRQQANEAGMRLPDEDIKSLEQLATDNQQRSQQAPRESEIYAGKADLRGYRVISAKELRQNPTMHVMNALVAHGCLVVDLTNGGIDLEPAWEMADMWTAVDRFFEKPSANSLAPMTDETKSEHAMAGFVSYDDGNLQFLETRRERESGNIVPADTELAKTLSPAFDRVVAIAQDITRIAVAASTLEREDDVSEAAAMHGATQLAKELLDDGRPLTATDIAHDEGVLSMSPHRLCRYAGDHDSSQEVFGAHTDSTFITAIPVAAVAGLEVYDEEAERWFRPELRALDDYKATQKDLGLPDDLEEVIDDKRLPWHARYVVCMPGELLQIATRDEIPAAVHRVVTKEAARTSAPILLRGRPGTKWDIGRYLVQASDGLAQECNGLLIEEIHAAMQVKSFE